MKTWKKIIDDVFEQKKSRGWTKLYWAIDLHDTVITGKYNLHNTGSEIYPYAKEVLDFLYRSEIHRTILWTSSYQTSIDEVIRRFGLKFHYIGKNPECPNTDLCSFDGKFYFNFLLDDKAGFDPYSDWEEIYKSLLKNL
jgi:hypothetical protein